MLILIKRSQSLTISSPRMRVRFCVSLHAELKDFVHMQGSLTVVVHEKHIYEAHLDPCQTWKVGGMGGSMERIMVAPEINKNRLLKI